jgi:hypothetical protein
VVVWVEFFVAVVSPVGETVVPLLVDPVVLVTTPLTVVVFSLLVETAATGAGMTGVVVCVVVVLEEEDCAKAPPAIRVTAIVAASKDLIMSNSPGTRVGAGIALLVFHLGTSPDARHHRKLPGLAGAAGDGDRWPASAGSDFRPVFFMMTARWFSTVRFFDPTILNTEFHRGPRHSCR